MHKSGAANPLAHSALPDAEAAVIRNLMERIDILENKLRRITKNHTRVNDVEGSEDIEVVVTHKI